MESASADAVAARLHEGGLTPVDIRQAREQRNLSVVFEKVRLARVLGDLLPAEGAAPQAGGVQPLLKPEPPAKPPAKPAAEPAAETAKTPTPPETPKEASLPATALPTAGAASEDPLRPRS